MGKIQLLVWVNITYPPVIALFLCGMFAIPKWVAHYCFNLIITISSGINLTNKMVEIPPKTIDFIPNNHSNTAYMIAHNLGYIWMYIYHRVNIQHMWITHNLQIIILERVSTGFQIDLYVSPRVTNKMLVTWSFYLQSGDEQHDVVSANKIFF